MFHASLQGLRDVLSQLGPHAWQTAGSAMRWEKCTYTQATGDRRDPSAEAIAPIWAGMQQHD